MQRKFVGRFLKDFVRHQIVTKGWRKEQWQVDNQRSFLLLMIGRKKIIKLIISCLKNTIISNGFVYAAFYDEN